MYSPSEKLCTNPKSGVPRRTSSSFKKLQRRGVCSSLVATRITTNYERQPRSTNPYGHEQCCVHEVKLRPSSCRYKYHLLTLHTSPTHQELILLSKTVILTTHGRGAVAVISKNVNSDLMRPQKVKSSITKYGPEFGYVFVEKTSDHNKPSVSPWSCSPTYATDGKNVFSLLLPKSLHARS